MEIYCKFKFTKFTNKTNESNRFKNWPKNKGF